MKKSTTPYGIAVFAVCLIAFANASAQTPKQLRPGEFEYYDEAIKDINAAAFTKAIGAMELWTQKFPESDFSADRAAFSVQAFAGANQPAKALDAAVPLFAKDVNALFTGDAAQAMMIRLLYNATWAVSHLANPTPEELATGEKAARELMRYDKPLPGVAASKWAEARTDMQEKADSALLYIAMLPGIQAMAKRPPDCAAAEAAYIRALSAYPERSTVSYELGRALSCEAKEMPERFVEAIWQFQRAAAIDATLGDPRNDPAKIRAYADNAYTRFHGGSEGLDHLKEQVKLAPLPPKDFRIATAAEVAQAEHDRFEQENPQLALWMKIRARLAEDDGPQYFEAEMKGSALPQLKGTIVDAKPACRAKELLIRMDGSGAEVTIRFDKPLTGKPRLQSELQWQGAAETFTRAPFLLTVKVEASALTGLEQEPCALPARKR